MEERERESGREKKKKKLINFALAIRAKTLFLAN